MLYIQATFLSLTHFFVMTNFKDFKEIPIDRYAIMSPLFKSNDNWVPLAYLFVKWSNYFEYIEGTINFLG